MYSVETDLEAVDQVEALPSKALVPYAEVVSLLEIAPWSGASYNRERPDVSTRTLTFGENGEGLVIYVVLDDQRRVVVLRVLWTG